MVDEKGEEYYNEQGEMIFTHFGISGPLVLSASCYICDKLKDHDFKCYIDLKPALDFETLDKRILKDFEKAVAILKDNSVITDYSENSDYADGYIYCIFDCNPNFIK